ncbi:hypothetical protein OBE_12828, partial [human gut metagenome]
YEDKARGEDWVFNYGMFSFNTPHFIYRFVKGETDYELGVTRYPYFEGQLCYAWFLGLSADIEFDYFGKTGAQKIAGRELSAGE